MDKIKFLGLVSLKPGISEENGRVIMNELNVRISSESDCGPGVPTQFGHAYLARSRYPTPNNETGPRQGTTEVIPPLHLCCPLLPRLQRHLSNTRQCSLSFPILTPLFRRLPHYYPTCNGKLQRKTIRRFLATAFTTFCNSSSCPHIRWRRTHSSWDIPRKTRLQSHACPQVDPRTSLGTLLQRSR